MSDKRIMMSHGGGGLASARLIMEEIHSRFGQGPLNGLPDGATLPGGIVFSTDSFVVTPRFFPGGDIGKLAVCGTANDIWVSGGVPKFLSLSLILEEGFSREELGHILDSVAETAKQCGVQIATGDTKVVPAGSADGIYLNTSGIGMKNPVFDLGRHRLESGDAVIVSGGIAEHGMAIMAARHDIGGKGVLSDCAPVGAFVDAAAQTAGKAVKFMRDPTRGGTGAVLNEIVSGTEFGIELEESVLPLNPAVRTLCGMMGIDPLFVPCEGRIAAIVGADAADAVLSVWKRLPGGELAAKIGELNSNAGEITLRGEWGGRRLMILPEGDPLPRIC